MPLYICRRVAALAAAFFIIISLSFMVVRLMPGSVYDDPNLPEEVRLSLEGKLGLDRPLLAQYAAYLKGIVTHGDFGYSLRVAPGAAVFDVIAGRAPLTLTINGAAVLIAVPLGLSLGALSALKGRGGWAFPLAAVVLMSAPAFVAASLLQYFVAYKWNITPILFSVSGSPWERVLSSVLPVAALALGPAAAIARLIRAELTEAREADYMALARAKGLSWRHTLFRHGLKNALTPLSSTLAFLLTGVVTGSLAIERIFSIPGMGSVLIDAINTRDHMLTSAVLIFYTFTELTALLLVDLAYCAIDPRIRMDSPAR